MWKQWKLWKYRKPARSQMISLGGTVFIIIGVTILFFGTPYKPNADAARSAWTFAAPFLAAGLILYAADFFIKR